MGHWLRGSYVCRLLTMVGVVVALAPRALAGQAEASLVQAAATITGAHVLRRIGVIADDSMKGRETPSVELELTARYVAGQFAAIGLRPGGGSSPFVDSTAQTAADPKWFQRYPLPGNNRLDYSRSKIGFTGFALKDGAKILGEDGTPIFRKVVVSFASAARLGSVAVPGWRESGRNVLIAGRHTAEALMRHEWGGRGIVYAPPAGLDSATQQRVIERLASVSRGVIVLRFDDSVTFARRLDDERRAPYPLVDTYLYDGSEDQGEASFAVVHVWAEAVKHVFAAGGIDLAQLHADTTPVVREVPGFRFVRDLVVKEAQHAPRTAPNVIGVLPGSDVALRDEYLVIVARMAHTSMQRGRADSANKGYNDNASGVAGLLELAKAFSRPSARPRRSLAFVAVSGGANESWGSKFFVKKWRGRSVGAIILDRIGHAKGGAISIDGARDLDLTVPPSWIAGAHPELGLTVELGETVPLPSSDHAAFMRRGIPALSFHGEEKNNERSADSLDAVDAEQEARILRLVLYVGHSLADTPQRPRWSAEGRRRRMKMLGQ
jgi:hypothetical protein